MRSILQWRARRNLASALVVAAAFATAACQSKTAGLDSLDSMSTASTAKPSFSATAARGKKWEADPANIEAGIAYANGLEALGQTDQQMSVLKTLAGRHPEDPKLQSLYGKKLLAAGRAAESIAAFESAVASGNADWRPLSALGSAYDQQGRYAEARTQYGKALQLQPEEISVLNNMGMSYALEGDLKQAETTLRRAAMLPKAAAEPRIRQNLALVVGLQGRFDEARKIASEDLPPDQVEANMDYLQKMLSQPNTWQQLSGETQG
ncbi:MAG: tetratricopeptide repeat protein [Hyphomicrobiales bacterium]